VIIYSVEEIDFPAASVAGSAGDSMSFVQPEMIAAVIQIAINSIFLKIKIRNKNNAPKGRNYWNIIPLLSPK